MTRRVDKAVAHIADALALPDDMRVEVAEIVIRTFVVVSLPATEDPVDAADHAVRSVLRNAVVRLDLESGEEAYCAFGPTAEDAEGSLMEGMIQMASAVGDVQHAVTKAGKK